MPISFPFLYAMKLIFAPVGSFTFTVPSALKSGVLVFLKAASFPSGLESNTGISEELALIPYLIQLHNYSLPDPFSLILSYLLSQYEIILLIYFLEVRDSSFLY